MMIPNMTILRPNVRTQRRWLAKNVHEKPTRVASRQQMMMMIPKMASLLLNVSKLMAKMGLLNPKMVKFRL